MHTFVYHRFTVTPRLTLTSPVRGCGKTTLLELTEAVCARPLKSDHITAASLYHAVDHEHPTLLIDEADNLGLAVNGPLRAVLNSGHRKGGKVTRYVHGQARSFSTFSPAAVAAIGTLPLPVMHRSIIIRMERHDGRRVLKRLAKDDVDTKTDLDIAYRMIFTWARETELNSDPPMPAPLRNRPADNWRPLIAIADAFGPDWATRAREAAVIFAAEHEDEDAVVVLLRDIRDIFRLAGADDAMWSEWRGIHGDEQPRKLNWRSCWRRFKYGHGRSGYQAHPENRRRRDTTGHNSRRRGGHIAKATARRHNLEISGICGAGKPSHPTFSKS